MVKRSEYAAEFADLAKHTTQTIHSPGQKFKETDLSRLITTEPQKHHRLTHALLVIFDGRQQIEHMPTRDALLATLTELLRRDVRLSENHIDPLLQAVVSAEPLVPHLALLSRVLSTIQRVIGSKVVVPEQRQMLLKIREQLLNLESKHEGIGSKLAIQIDTLCDDSTVGRLHPDEGWADDLRQWVAAHAPRMRSRWDVFLQDTAAVRPQPPATDWSVDAADTGLDLFNDREAAFDAWCRMRLERLPAAAWKEVMSAHVRILGRAAVADCLRRVLHKVPGSKPGMLARQSLNRELLRGLLWLCVDLASPELAQAVQHATRFFYEANSPLAETGVAVLFQMPERTGAAPLASLAQRVTAGIQIAFLDTALTAMAERLGLDREDLVDDAVPTFGLTELGRLTRDYGSATVELRIVPNRATKMIWAGQVGRKDPQIGPGQSQTRAS